MTESAAQAIAPGNALPALAPVAFSGAETIVETLVNHGVKHVFIFPGGTIAPILDTIDLMKPIAKAAFQVTDIRELPRIMEQAYALASTGRKGPVVIDLPMNVQRSALPCGEYTPVPATVAQKTALPDAQLKTLAKWIECAERPVILAGGGAVQSGAEAQIRRLAERFAIPVAMSLPGIGAYPSAGPL